MRNYETWLTYVWLTNDEGTYHACRDLARQCWAAGDLAARLKTMIEDGNPLSARADLYSDLLNADVDWHEIASGFAEDMEE